MREIDALDRALRRSGHTSVTLVCPPATTVTCRAMVRGYEPAELTEGITQQDSHVIISPTEINAAVWPAVYTLGQIDPRIPSRNRGDTCVIDGKTRQVINGKPFYIGTTLVRIELQVR